MEFSGLVKLRHVTVVTAVPVEVSAQQDQDIVAGLQSAVVVTWNERSPVFLM